jgi:hypothetical protein
MYLHETVYGLVGMAHDEPPIWTLVCPSINAIFEEPVVASDGRSFSKKALRSLMASCKERGCPSPLNSGKRSRSSSQT